MINNIIHHADLSAYNEERTRPTIEVSSAMARLNILSPDELWDALSHCDERPYTLRPTGTGAAMRITLLSDVIDRLIPVWRRIQGKRIRQRVRRADRGSADE